MAEVTDITIVNGIPTAGSGTVPTLAPIRDAIGSLTETAPTTDTASSGLNGRLQRVAQNLTTMTGRAVAQLGARTTAQSPAINIASDDAQIGTKVTAITALASGGTGLIGWLSQIWNEIQTRLPAALGAGGGLKVQIYDTGGSALTYNANGQATMANSSPVTIASNQSAVPVSNTPLTNIGAGEYETVAASQTAQVLGATGAAGDYLSGLLVTPATTSPGNVIILDNATSITVFVGGASSVSNLVPFFISLGMISVSGAWKVTTGSNVSVIGIGNFT